MSEEPRAGSYFNNAGTSWPKPPGVAEAMQQAIELGPWETAEAVEQARASVAAFFGMPSPERFVFTSGCTAALQLALHGTTWRAGDAVITSAFEHEALAGPVRALVRNCGVEHFVAPRSEQGPIDLNAVGRRLEQGGVRLVAVTHAGNVTGDLLPVAGLVQLAHAHGALVLLDAAQTAGLIPLEIDPLGVDAVAFAGHKGLLGPAGVGGLWVGPGLRMGVVTGSCAESEACEADPPPSWCEAGTANAPAIAGLAASLAWIEETGLAGLRMAQVRSMTALLAGLGEIEGLRVLGQGPALRRTNVVSVVSDRLAPVEIERRLREEHGLHARAGEHCAPMAHEALGTSRDGTLRLSLGPCHEQADLDRLLAALEAIVG
jgi:selenocysteine lyase/cysteine desulfurase